MLSTRIFGTSSQLPAKVHASDARHVGEYSQGYYGAATLALLGMIAAAGALVEVDVTFTSDTSIHASGDVLADATALVGAVRTDAGYARLESITITDKDDQTAAAMDVVLLRSNTSIGTLNAAPDLTDTEDLEVLGIVNILAADFIDVGGSKIATKVLAVPLPVKAASGTTIYAALITRGTPTQTASGLVAKFFLRHS